MQPVSGANYIGSELLKSGSKTFRSLNPATGEEFPTVFHQATSEEVDRAVQLAQAAFEPFTALSPLERASFLERIAEVMQANQAELEASFSRESALPADRAHTELVRTCFQLTSFAEALRNGTALHAIVDPAQPDRKPTPKPDLRKVNTGLGPVIVFGASNFPFAYSTIGGDSASALAAGCPVIVKGHPMHAATSELVAQLVIGVAQEFHLPEGVFSHVHAIDFSVGERLVSDERVKAVGFTGSFKGGMALHKLSQARKEPIPVFAEMGSVNPVIVLPEAMKATPTDITRLLTHSVALNAGQFCTSPGLLFIEATDAAADFIQQLTTGLSAIAPQCMLHPGIKAHYNESRKLQRNGADLLVDHPDTDDNFITPGLFAISGKQFLDEPQRRQEEVFGSFLLIIRCKDSVELLDCLAQLNGQLTGSLFFDDAEAESAQKVLPFLQRKVGRIILNGVPTGVEVSPAQQHGGTFPASTDSRFTAVGADAIARFMRPVAFQNCPDRLLPEALKRHNPYGILRFVNGLFSKEPC